MKIENALKGHTICSIFETLLVDAGYHVVPFGIERVIREVRPLHAEDYLSVMKPWQNLRSMPDLFVLDLEKKKGWLTEVKYKKKLSRAIVKEFDKYKQTWGPFNIILALSTPPSSWTGEVKHIRVFEVNKNTELNSEFFEDNGKRIQDVFKRLGERWEELTILKAQEMISNIAQSYESS